MTGRPRHHALDDTDRALLEALQDDCKRSLAQLGEGVGLSAPSVLERVRKLEQAGVVRGYYAVLDPRAAGLDIGAFIGVGIDRPAHIATFERAVLSMPDVLECHHVTGRHTLVLKVRTENTESLQRLISALRELPGVERTETMVVLATQMERTRVAIPKPPRQDDSDHDAAPRRRRGPRA